MEQYNITGMSCSACSSRIEKVVSDLPGVSGCSVSLLTNSMAVEGTASEQEIIHAVEKAGYGASLKKTSLKQGEKRSGTDTASELEDRETPRIMKRFWTSLVFLLALMYLSMGHMMWGWPLPQVLEDNHVAMGLLQMILSGIILVINGKFFVNGVRGLLHRSPNMDTLVALGAGASYGYSTVMLFIMTDAVMKQEQERVLYAMHHLYFESAAMILVLITLGKALETRSKGRTTNALKELLALTPKKATILEDGMEKEVDLDDVRPGDLFIVRPGRAFR